MYTYNIDHLTEKAELIAMKEREQYLPLMMIILSQPHLIIGGVNGIKMLINGGTMEFDKDNYMLDVYCPDTFNNAKKIALTIVSTMQNNPIPVSTVSLQTNLKHREFTLSIYARMLAKFYSTNKITIDTNSREYKLISTSINRKLVLSRDMQMTDIYQILYSPSANERWSQYMEFEKQLVSKTGGRIKYKHKQHGVNQHKTYNIQELLSSIVHTSVIVGEIAVDMTLGKYDSVAKYHRIQVIASDINDIVNLLKKVTTQTTYHKVNTPAGLVDFQLIMWSFDNLPIDVFNSSAYQMIPFKPIRDQVNGKIRDIKIGNIWVILRFLYIDILWLSMIQSHKVDHRRELVAIIRAHKNATDQFQLDNYMGVYIDPTVAKRDLIMKEQAAGMRFYNFYPAKIGGDEDLDEPDEGETLYFRREDAAIPEYKQSIDTSETQYKQAGNVDISETQPFTTNLVSSPINFNHKNICAIVHKITRVKCVTTCDVVTNLINYTNQTIATPWGQKQSSTKTFHNFKAFLPVGLNSVLDLGCGSGADMNALVDMIPIKKVYLADIKNSLDRAYAVVRRPGTSFCQVKEHARIGVQSGSIDLICMFHCIHHMMEPIEFRIKDCIRMLAPGGLLFLKDHNIKTHEDAQLVDCEHFIYLLPELSQEVNNGTATRTVTNLFEAAAIQNINSDAINSWLIREIAAQFDKIEPMKYYSSDHIVNLIVTNGMQLQSLIITNSLTNVYMGIFKKVV